MKLPVLPDRRASTQPARLFAVPFLALPLVLLTLAGCGTGMLNSTSSSSANLLLNGHVHGGQQPVGYSTIQLWSAGTGGNGSAATPMIPNAAYFPGGAPNCSPASQSCNTGVISDGGGNFTLTGDYTCRHATDQVYLTATGGNPGLSSGTNNAALLMMAALGSCGNLSASTEITVDEVTTVAAVWALAPFMDQNGNVGASATNTAGLANAFLNAQLLANTASGTAATLPATLSIETGKLYALANTVASCVNSDGTGGCQPLFAAVTPAGGTAPANTVAAALNVVRNPSQNVAAVFNASSPIPPFFSSLTTPPADWTMSLTVTGCGLYYPTALAVDSVGNVWAGGYFGSLSGISPQGAPLSPNGFGLGTLSEVYGLAIDSSNNIWVTNEEQPYHGNQGSITKFNGASSGAVLGSIAGLQYNYSPGTEYPIAIAADTNGNMLAANFGNSTATLYNSVAYYTMDGIGSGSAGGLAFPVAASFDPSHGMWLANEGDNTVAHFDASGNLAARISCCNGASGIATDAQGNAWITNYYGSSISEVSNANAVLLQADHQGGVSYPSGLVLDAGQNVWVANFRGASISEFAGSTSSLPAGTGISPAKGLGLDAGIVEPFGIAVDPSGNVWISNFNAASLTMFFGLATPTATPAMPVPTAP